MGLLEKIPFFDNLLNFATGLGVMGKDPTTSSKYHLRILNRNELENAYRSDWIARKIVDAPAEDATREWRSWIANGEQIEAIEACEKKFYLQRKLRWAIIRARLYGGAGLVIGVDDGRNTWEPIDYDAIEKDGLKFVVVLNRYELMAGPRIYNVFSEWYTRPEYYTVATPLFGFSYEQGGTYPAMGKGANALPSERYNFGQAPEPTPQKFKGQKQKPGGRIGDPMQEEGDRARQMTPAAGMVKVHPSRVVELAGNEMPDWRLVPMGGWWGDSVLQTVDEVLKDFGLTIGGIANMVNDAKMDVVRIPNLSKNLATKEYASRITARFQAANLSKGAINSLLLDKEEEWQRIQTSFGSLPELMREFMTVAAGAGGIPVSRLMGQSPGRGLSSASSGGGGESDLRNYYDGVSSYQETYYRPAMEPLDECIIRSAIGKRDPNIHYEWNPLYQENPLEVAQIAKVMAEVFQTDVNTGVINENALRRGRVNQLVEDGTYPGLEDAIEEFGEEPDVPEARIWSPGVDPVTGKPIAVAGPSATQKALPGPGGGSGSPKLGGASTSLPGASKPTNGSAEKSALKDAFSPDQPRDDHGRWSAGAEHGLPEGSKFVEGRGILGSGKVGVVVPGHGMIPGSMIGNLHPTEQAAAHEARQLVANKAASERAKQDRTSQLKGIASRLSAGEDPSHSDLATLRLKEKAGLKWFMPAAAELFGISSRAVRPHIAQLIKISHSMGGVKLESVHSASGLKAIAAGLKAKATDALDATPRTLYVRRDVLNGDDIVAWAKSAGFSTTLPADDLHVTICYSRTPVDWMKMGSDTQWGVVGASGNNGSMNNADFIVPAGGARLIEKFGDAIVLLFNSSPLSWRHESMVQAGASWDHDEYQPHITITWEPDGVDWKAMEPYRGPIMLGPEIFETVNEDFRSEIVEDAEKKTKAEVDYGPGKPESRCGICKHFDGEDGCALVAGEIDPDDWCKLFERKPRHPASRSEP